MSTVARIKKDGTLLTKSEINERLPVVTDGLVAHYPLDNNTINQYMKSLPSTAKVLGSGGQPLYDWFNSNTLLTYTSDILSVSVETAKQYDLIVYDAYVWNVSESIMSKLKSFVDAGVSCVAAGNDTRTNVFVTAYGGSTQSTHNIKIVSNPAGIEQTLYTGGGEGDLMGGIVSLASNCYPYYRRTDTNEITGYFYKSPTSGAVLFFNQEAALGWNDTFIKNGTLFAYNNSIGRVTNTNTIVTEDGIGIQVSTTNLLSDGSTFNNWGLTSNSGSIPTVTPNCEISPIGKLTADKIYIPNDGTYPRLYHNFTPSSTDLHTFSIWLKSVGGTCQTQIGIFRNSPWASPNLVTFTITNKWEKYSFTFNPLDTTSHQVYIGSHDSTKGYTYFAWGAQVEIGGHASSFVDGTIGQSMLTIPNPVTTGNYTINFKCKILNNVGESIGYQTILSMGDYYTTNSWTIMDQGYPTVGGYQTLIRKGNSDEWAWASGNLTSPSNYKNLNTYTIVRNNTDYLCYLNGVLTGSIAHLSGTMQDVIYIGSRDAGAQMGSIVVSDFSIYNRALSTDEVKKLAGENFKVESTNITTNNLIETPILPLDTYYYPLSNDTNDVYNTLNAYTNTNVAFEDGAVWVGTSTTNLWNEYQPLVANSGYNQYLGYVGPNKTPMWRFFKTGTDNQWNGWEASYPGFGVNAGTPFTISFYSRKDTLSLGWVTLMYASDWSHAVSTGVSGSLNTTSAFKKSYGTITYTETVSGAIIADGPSWGYSPLPGSIEIAAPMWEMNKTFPSPFVLGTRGATHLSYNLNSSIGLDWNSDWSICYWKKPIATFTDNLTGYNIESLGCNSNSVGGSYIWWGKDNGADGINGSSPYPITPSDYFGNWQFISLVKSGQNITIKTWLNNGTISIRTIGVGSINTNAYVTQYGYDLKLGGWDNTNPTNTYFRDLVVARRAFTDAELLSMYKQFSITKTNVHTKFLIEEGL